MAGYLLTEVFCHRQFMRFTSTLEGCASEISGQFGENELNSKTNDFSALGSNLRTWQQVAFTVKNNTITTSVQSIRVFPNDQQS